MQSDAILLFLAGLVRWTHIACATLAIGVPFFVFFVLSPAADKTLDEAQHKKLRDTINIRWRKIVYIFITLFILTGLFQFFVPVRVNGVLVSARWMDFSPDAKRTYHMIFGIKMLGALGMFFLASALAGRTKTFAPIREKQATFLKMFLLLSVVVLACAIALHYLHA